MTRQLIMWNLVTLEGYFEGAKKWDLDWLKYVWGNELEAFSLEQGKTADALLFGRITYEGMAAHWPSATGAIADFMNAIPKIVFSRTLKEAGWNNTRIVRDDPAREVVRLKAEGDGALLVFGSADLSSTLIEHDLFDEYRLCVVPVLLGTGTPLFKPGSLRKRLTLRRTWQLSPGGVVLYYGRGSDDA